MRTRQNQQPTLFDAAPAPGDGPATPAAVAEPEAPYRPGFRWVKRIGWVPEDWDVRRLSDLAVINPRKDKFRDELMSVSFVEMADVDEEARLCNTTDVEYRGVATGYTSFKEGDILVAKITPCFENGKGAIASGLSNGYGFGSTEFHVIRPGKDVDPNFVYYHTTSYLFRERGRMHMTGSAGQKRVPTYFVEDYLIPFPSIPEQHKIARILGTWYRALAQLDALIAAKEQHLKGLMQQLLFGAMRFPQYKERPWREVRLGEVLKEVTRPADLSAGKSIRLLSVRRRSEGLFIRDNGEIQGTLKVVHEGDFLISRRQVVHGASGLAKAEHHGAAVSNSYSVLVSRDPAVLDIRFFDWLSKTPELYHIAYLSSYGVHIEKFIFHLRFYFKHKVRIPQDIEEQRTIIGVLESAETEIDLLRQKRAALAEQKKGLMQRLLTGEVRVTPDPEDFEAAA